MKKNTTKKALLMSCLSLLLCCSMLVGTTFAWFTDTASTGRNQIIAGNLDVELNDVDGNSIEGDDDIFVTPDGSVKGLWEPGHVEVAYLQVKNAGTLALTYELAMNILSETTAVNMAGDTFKLSEHLQLAVVDYTDKYASREEALAAATNATKFSALFTSNSAKLEPNQSKNIAMIVWMPETVGNEANYRGDVIPTIDFGISVFATQVGHENDSFGPDYDENLIVRYTYDATKTPEANGTALWNTIMNAEDGAAIFASAGLYKLNDGQTSRFNGKSFTLIGEGDVVIEGAKYGIVLQDSTTPDSDVVINLKNITVKTSHSWAAAIYAKYNITVNLYDVKTQTAGGTAILLDNCNIYDDGQFHPMADKRGTVVNAYNVTVDENDKVELNANPCNAYPSEADTYAYFNFWGGNIKYANCKAQDVCKKPENVFINNLNPIAYDAATKTYTIDTAEGMMAINDIIATAGPSESNIIHFKLAADVDMSDYTWTPIRMHWANFDGQGHTVSNLNCGMDATAKSGFAGYLGAATLKNVTLNNVTVAGEQAGIIAGNAEAGTIENVTITGNNSVSYMNSAVYDEAYAGVGAIFGVNTAGERTVGVTVAAGATIAVDYNDMPTKASYGNENAFIYKVNATVNGTVSTNGVYGMAVYDAADLRNALAAYANATEDMTVFVLDNVFTNESFTLVQNTQAALTLKAVNTGNVKFVKNDAGNIFLIDGNSTYANKAVVIDGFVFEVNTGDTYAIALGNQAAPATRYACNVTVQNCDFTGVGYGIQSGGGSSAKNFKVIHCNSNGNGGFISAYITDLTVEDCVINAGGGINNQSAGTTVKGCTINTSEYCIRGNGGPLVISGCTLVNTNTEADSGAIVLRLNFTAEKGVTLSNTTIASDSYTFYRASGTFSESVITGAPAGATFGGFQN